METKNGSTEDRGNTWQVTIGFVSLWYKKVIKCIIIIIIDPVTQAHIFLCTWTQEMSPNPGTKRLTSPITVMFCCFLLLPSSQHVLTAADIAAVHPAEQQQHVQQQWHEPQQRLHGHQHGNQQHGPDGRTDERHLHVLRVLTRLALHRAWTGKRQANAACLEAAGADC